ncbi:MAG: hypothetical protein V4608_07055 [Bacteroidota bacterium]
MQFISIAKINVEQDKYFFALSNEGNYLLRPEVRRAFKNLVKEGWRRNSANYLNEIIYTFWDYFRNSYKCNAGLRIDYFLLSRDLTNRLLKTGVYQDVSGWEKTNDRAPVWIELVNI